MRLANTKQSHVTVFEKCETIRQAYIEADILDDSPLFNERKVNLKRIQEQKPRSFSTQSHTLYGVIGSFSFATSEREEN